MLTWVEDLVDFLLPTACLGCRGSLSLERSDELVCAVCRTRLEEPPWPRCSRCDLPLGTGRRESATCLECRSWPPALLAARAAVLLEPPADALVHALKYEGWRRLASLMGLRMARIPLPATSSSAVVVPVPTTAARERVRGYNQARLLAQVFAKERGYPLRELLARPKGGRTQVALQPSQRRANVRNAFAVREGWKDKIRGKEILLVDDVLTTGSTATAATLALEGEGILGVTLITFARALPFRV